MMFIDELYQKTVADNETNLKIWENHLNSLKSLNFDTYTDKLKVPVLVPIGNKIFFRGELKHTNEVTVSLGADYFVKCSTAQAEILRQHRIKGAQSHVDQYRKEKEYLEKQISLTKENVYERENEGQEILEVYSEAEDKAWREKHRENVKKYKQQTSKEETKPENALTDEELWEKLEVLDLQEELENEMLDNLNEIVDKRKENTFLMNEETLLLNSFKEENKVKSDERNHDSKGSNNTESMKASKVHSFENKEDSIVTEKAPNETLKHDLLQQVIDKQSELENKLLELKYREREQSKTEQDLLARLDEMEQLDELEDEMERLDDILQTEGAESDDSNQSEDNSGKEGSTQLRKSISFADENSETIEIPFTHSETEPNNNPYDLEKGISKPSDLYEAYSNLFNNKTTSILKKTKYGYDDLKHITQNEKPTRQVKFEESVESHQSFDPEEISADRTIVIKDVVENIAVNQHNIEGGARPTSIFKKRRMQNKS